MNEVFFLVVILNLIFCLVGYVKVDIIYEFFGVSVILFRFLFVFG